VSAGAPSGPATGYPVERQQRVDSYLAGLTFTDEPGTERLREAMRYSLLAPAKRIRPVLALATAEALGHDPDGVLPLAAAIEMIHTYSLIHDDLPAMDDDDLRRGQPTCHKAYGEDVAILAGDALFAEAFRLALTEQSGEPANVIAAARELAAAVGAGGMVGGQFLDVLVSARDWERLDHAARVEQCRTVIRFKSAKYSVEQPLLIGAYAAGAPDPTVAALSGYGLALGEAFQLRDDVLGVFGDPAMTGKPAGDDLREGKRTVLVAHALEHADATDATTLLGALGDRDLDSPAVQACRDILRRSGAVERTEAMITAGAERARAVLDGIPDLTGEGRDALTDLIVICTARST